jgi:hypothetical protein
MRVPGLAIQFPFGTPGRSKTAAECVTETWAYSV